MFLGESESGIITSWPVGHGNLFSMFGNTTFLMSWFYSFTSKCAYPNSGIFFNHFCSYASLQSLASQCYLISLTARVYFAKGKVECKHGCSSYMSKLENRFVHLSQRWSQRRGEGG